MWNFYGDHEQAPSTLKVSTIFKLSSKPRGNNEHPQRTGCLFSYNKQQNKRACKHKQTAKFLAKQKKQNERVLYVFCCKQNKRSVAMFTTKKNGGKNNKLAIYRFANKK